MDTDGHGLFCWAVGSAGLVACLRRSTGFTGLLIIFELLGGLVGV